MLKQVMEKLTLFWKQFKQFLRKTYFAETNEKERWGLEDIAALILRTLKLLVNVAFVFILFGMVLGAGIGVGYGASLFSKTEVQIGRAHV